jgi:ankyrin repeat protein
MAVYDGQLNVVKIMINSGANIRSNGDALLYLAACKNHLAILKALVEAGADLRRLISDSSR